MLLKIYRCWMVYKKYFWTLNNLHKYDMIGDVRIAFKCFKNLPVMSDLTLKEFSLTLAMLLCLILGVQWMQTIHLIRDLEGRRIGIAQIYVCTLLYFVLKAAVLHPSYQNDGKTLSIVKSPVGRRWLRN